MMTHHHGFNALSCWDRARSRRWGLWAGMLVAGVTGLTACAGGSDEEPTAAPAAQRRYQRMVVFGDSLSDVGSYATPGLQAATQGGKYTVNGPEAKIWVERVAATVGVDMPCAAQTGLDSSGPLAAYAQPPSYHENCFGYAQGGSRVKEPAGVKNKEWLKVGDPTAALGQLTVPVTEQMKRHLEVSNYQSHDLVTVLAGANDVFIEKALAMAQIRAGGNAQQVANATAVRLAQIGGTLAEAIRTQVTAKGAKQVVVLNLPDMAATPTGGTLSDPEVQILRSLVQSFNAGLRQGLNGVAEVLLIDAYSRSQTYAANPQAFGLSNVTKPACDLARASLGSLVCSQATVVAGDVSHYLYADMEHPTPYGHQVWTDFVLEQMRTRGWL